VDLNQAGLLIQDLNSEWIQDQVWMKPGLVPTVCVGSNPLNL
jgi:hypothetical protein